MFAEEIERPFDFIESAHDYMDILATTTLEVLSELERDRDQALRDGDQRRRFGPRLLHDSELSGVCPSLSQRKHYSSLIPENTIGTFWCSILYRHDSQNTPVWTSHEPFATA
jgi:hypothetical protein